MRSKDKIKIEKIEREREETTNEPELQRLLLSVRISWGIWCAYSLYTLHIFYVPAAEWVREARSETTKWSART